MTMFARCEYKGESHIMVRGTSTPAYKIKLPQADLFKIARVSKAARTNGIDSISPEVCKEAIKNSSIDKQGSILDKLISYQNGFGLDNPTLLSTIEKLVEICGREILDLGSIPTEGYEIRSIWDFVIHKGITGSSNLELIPRLIELNADVNVCSFNISNPETTKKTLLDKLVKKLFQEKAVSEILGEETPRLEKLESLSKEIILTHGAILSQGLTMHEELIFQSLVSGNRTKNSSFDPFFAK